MSADDLPPYGSAMGATPHSPPGPAPDAEFVPVARLHAQKLGARLVAEVDPARRIEGLGQHAHFASPEEKADFEARFPFLAPAPYETGAFRVWEVSRAMVLHYPRAEGLTYALQRGLVSETRGSPRAERGNPWMRIEDGQFFLHRDLRPTHRIRRAAICYDTASRNFAHFMMLMLPRLVLMDAAVADTPFIIPDLPNYGVVTRAGIRQELLGALPEIMALSHGNRYVTVGEGVLGIDEVVLIGGGRTRWDLVLHPDVAAAFTRIAAQAMSARSAAGAPPLPRRIYISREKADMRRVANHAEVESLLLTRGFVSVKLEELDFLDQAALFAEAEVVVGPHGAGLANMLFSDGRTRLLEFYPDGEPQNHFALCAVARGCRYMPMRAEKLNKKRHMKVDIGQLDRGLDVLLAD